MAVKMQMKIPVQIFKEGKAFVAYSPVLDLSTSGKSFEVVQKRFKEMVEIFFEELDEMGTMDEVLAGLGWIKVKRQWNPPIPISHDIADISIPLNN